MISLKPFYKNFWEIKLLINLKCDIKYSHTLSDIRVNIFKFMRQMSQKKSTDF